MGVSPAVDPEAFVVGCDSGYDHASALGHPVDLLVGDLDSISSTGLAHAESEGVAVERHPRDKDATDFELAIDACVVRGHTAIDVYGGEGGRIDHLLAIATALTADKWRDVAVQWHTAHGITMPLNGPGTLTVRATPQARVSLVAMTDTADITTTGLVWPLDKDSLERGSSRGISNIAEGDTFAISIGVGSLLITVSTDHTTDDIEGSTTP